MLKTSLIWFRRDLRLHDHAALYHALKTSQRVIAVFIFDTAILTGLPKDDRRVTFIWHCLRAMQTHLRSLGSDLIIAHGEVEAELLRLVHEFDASAVYANRDYEPAAIARDEHIANRLSQIGKKFFSFKDQVIFEEDEVLTQNQAMYSVFTPYRRTWLAKLTPFFLKSYAVEPYLKHLAQDLKAELPDLEQLGFSEVDVSMFKPGADGGALLLQDFLTRMHDYHLTRDFPAVKGVSYLSVHLRFGTVSIRELVRLAWQVSAEGAQTWLSELIWREFYQQILWHRPDVLTHAFKPQYDNIAFPNNPVYFSAWCDGQTGFPIVDAAMRQLNQTGYMHNRLRMITASFLVKDLLVDWRLGERYFAEKLIDYDLAANNGGWQWAASTGCDAQPYFRIFNPTTQSQRFDPQGKFIRRYCPEISELSDVHAPWALNAASQQKMLAEVNYPRPIVDHAVQRQAALALFKRQS